ncbi:MAG: FAD-binding oxidoreductase, partial [Anaerolineales bacterium]
MRRWNGWGDDSVAYPLPDTAQLYLNDIIGPTVEHGDASFESVLSNMPSSTLPDNALIDRDPALRVLHARGQSLPDWIALRSGRLGAIPDAVAFPQSAQQVRSLLSYAGQHHIQLIPYGGGTSVVGHINPLQEFGPALTVSMRRMNKLLELDSDSRSATFGAGINGPEIEARLGEYGFTLGHYPQSWEYSTLGGWIATRSSGQQSYFYGRIEDLLLGASIESPAGGLIMPVQPASAAGPDIRQTLLGSEGRMGVITEATVRVRPLPESEVFCAAFFPEWGPGVAAARQIAQERV